MRYEVFNYITGETVGYTNSLQTAKRYVRKYRHRGYDYCEVEKAYDTWIR